MPAPAPLQATGLTQPRQPTSAPPELCRRKEGGCGWCWGAPRAPQPPLGDGDQAPRGTQSTEGCSRVAPLVLGVSPGSQDGGAEQQRGSAAAVCRAGGADNTERSAGTVQAGQGWRQAKLLPRCGRTPALPSPPLPAQAPSAPGCRSTHPPRSHWSPGYPQAPQRQEPAHLLERKHTAQPWAALVGQRGVSAVTGGQQKLSAAARQQVRKRAGRQRLRARGEAEGN